MLSERIEFIDFSTSGRKIFEISYGKTWEEYMELYLCYHAQYLDLVDILEGVNA